MDHEGLAKAPPKALFFTGRNLRDTKYLPTPIGKNTLVEIGKEVAQVLSKENPESFMGHCWHRSSATAAAHNGASTVELKTCYDWAQDSMVKEYVDRSRASMRRMVHFLQTTTDTGTKKCSHYIH